MNFLWLVTDNHVVKHPSHRRLWGILALLLLTGLGTPLVTVGQGLHVLGIPLDSLLNVTSPRVNKTYIATYYSRFHLYLVSDRQAYGIGLGEANQVLHYKPNLFWGLGLGFDYKWANTQLTVKVPFLGHQASQKGNTNPFGISVLVNTNNRRFWLAGQYQSYRGFYLANPDVLAPNWLQDHGTYPSRPDLSSQTLTTHVEYLFNALRVSIPASLLQREGQRKTADSWVLGGFLTYHRLGADSAFAPSALGASFTSGLTASRFESVAVGLDGGYRQTVVFGQGWFLTMSIQPGVSVLVEHDNAPGRAAERRLRLGWQGLGSLSMGYSSARYYGGIYGSISLPNRVVGTSLVRTDGEYIRVVVGRRIRYAPRGLLKKVPGLG